MSPSSTSRLLLALALSVLSSPNPLQAQTPEEVTRAQQLQEAGDFSAAADALRPYLQRFPDDTGTRWLFGRLLHWAGNHAEARRAYEAVLAGSGGDALTPDDPWLTLEYAQVLMALGEWGKARGILQGLLAEEPVGGGAEVEANRQLSEIRYLTRPWAGLALNLLDDNQPFRRYQGGLEGGVFLTPLWSFSAGADPRILDETPGDGQNVNAGDRQGADAWGQIRGSIPGLRMNVTLRGGGTVQEGHSSWIGGAEAGFGLSKGFILAASANRSRYLWTLSSADTLVMVNTAELRLDRAEAPGWAGEAGLRRESFADDNHITSAYGWILAPVIESRFRLGYAFSWSDAQETRWTTRLPGRYAPYFTPNDEGVHSALAELRGTAGSLSLKLNGSLGFRAREEAPVLVVTGLEPEPLPGGQASAGTLFFYERSFTPWRVTATASLPLSDALTLSGRVEAWETAYYRVKQFGVGLVYRFGGWGDNRFGEGGR